MNIYELLTELKGHIDAGRVSKDTVLTSLGITTDANTKDTKQKHFSLTYMLYLIGALVLVLGIIFLVAQIWGDIGSLGRVSLTLVLGLVFATLGSWFLITEKGDQLGDIFHVVGGLLIPSGIFVLLNEYVTTTPSLWTITLICTGIALFYILLAIQHKRAVLTFFAISDTTIVAYALVSALIQNSRYIADDVFALITMSLGIGYFFLGRAYIGTWNKKLVSYLYLAGSLAFFIAGFNRIYDYGLVWELLYLVFACVGVGIALSVKSRILLFVSTGALIGYFVYMTNEYFADSLGWPISLVLLGFVLIGLGYASVTLGKKYITN